MKLRASVCFAVREPTRLILCSAQTCNFLVVFSRGVDLLFRLVHSVGFRQQLLPFSLAAALLQLRGFVVFQD